MAIRGLTLSATKRHISKLDPAYPAEPGGDVSGCTVAVLGPLDVFADTYIQDAGTQLQEGELKILLQRMALETVRFGLKGLENFQDENGKLVEFKTAETVIAGRRYTVVADDVLVQLPRELVREYSSEIRALSGVSKDEAGN